MTGRNLTFLVTEVTDRMERASENLNAAYCRAVTYQIMDGDERLDYGQWRWAAPTKDELPAYAVGDEFELAPKQMARGYGVGAVVPHLSVGQLWWLSSEQALVQVLKGVGRHDNFAEVMVMSQVPNAKARMGDKAMIGTCQIANRDDRVFGPEYGPIFIAWGDRKVAS